MFCPNNFFVFIPRAKMKTTSKNFELAWIEENDPTRFRQRTVKPKKGKGRKERPRNNNRITKESGDDKD